MAHYAKRAHGRGKVWKDAAYRGGYRGQVTIGGKRRSVSGNEGECHKALDRLLDGADEGRAEEEDATVGAWLAQWVESIADTRTENTRQNRRGLIKRWGPIAAMRMDAVRAPHVEAVLRADAAAGYSHNTLIHMRAVLGMAYRSWNGRTGQTFNPAREAVIPETVARRKREALEAEQATALLEVAEGEPRWGLLVSLGLWFGLRPGEVAGLTWANVDTEAGTISVRRMRRRSPGKDGKQVLSLTDAPKADSFRTLAIPAEVLAQLRRHKATQATARLASPRWADHDLVVCTDLGTPVDPSNQRRQILKMAKAAGIFRHLTPNELRHTACTLLIDAGYSETEVADFLGHVNTRMVRETYRHKRTGRTVDMTAGMAAALGA